MVCRIFFHAADDFRLDVRPLGPGPTRLACHIFTPRQTTLNLSEPLHFWRFVVDFLERTPGPRHSIRWMTANGRVVYVPVADLVNAVETVELWQNAPGQTEVPPGAFVLDSQDYQQRPGPSYSEGRE